jgi:hypothetical protein
MKFIARFLLIFCALVFSGCVTKDFKVVDALRAGLTKEEAKATIASFGFERSQVLERPASGWASEGTFTNLPSRARVAEERSKKTIATAEYYPVGHGLLGAGQLFLFYGEDGRLVDFYRYQIN